MGPTIAEWHQRSLAATGALVRATRAEHFPAPTPCDGWDVRALLNHIVAGNWWAAELAAGRTIAEVGDRFDGDVLGDDAASAYAVSADAAAAAFTTPGALDAPCAVSYGPVPGAVYAGHRFIDVLVHGWDLAVATGQPADLDPQLVTACWDVVVPQLDMLRGSGVFGTDQPVATGAGKQAQLLAALGRNPEAGRAPR